MNRPLQGMLVLSLLTSGCSGGGGGSMQAEPNPSTTTEEILSWEIIYGPGGVGTELLWEFTQTSIYDGDPTFFNLITREVELNIVNAFGTGPDSSICQYFVVANSDVAENLWSHEGTFGPLPPGGAEYQGVISTSQFNAAMFGEFEIGVGGCVSVP